MGPNLEIDARLLRRCRHGSTEAFRELVEQLKRPAYYHALSLTGNADDALDVSQEAFTRAWRAIRRFDPDRPFYPWYYTILRRLALNSIRSRARRRQESAEALSGLAAPEENSPEARYQASRDVALVHRILGQMSIADREILTLKDLHDHSYREIASILDIPTGTVMSRLYTARQRFRQMIENSGYDYP